VGSTSFTTITWQRRAAAEAGNGRSADLLLRLVDTGLISILCVAPFFFGGRHDLGRFVLLMLIAVTSAAWFARQAILPSARWNHTAAFAIPILAVGLLVFQMIPLPTEWLAWLSPRTAELLPLWTPGGSDAASLGTWQTVSLIPHETAKSLAMFVGYSLLFVVVMGRIASTADIQRLLNYLAAAAVLMAVFGIAQYYTSDGRFFWFYVHPWRTSNQSVTGAFINRNHFASFLVFGIGPLVACLLAYIPPPKQTGPRQAAPANRVQRFLPWAFAAALVVVILAILGSRSRGGAIVMLVSGGVLVTVYVTRGLVDRRFVYALGGLVALVVGLLSFHGIDEVAERLDDFAEGSIDAIDHGAIRRKIWTANIAAFKAGWLTGTGAGSHREICPVYLPESLTKEYTHAENGFLQIATETGVFGIALVAAGIAFCGAWCVRCFRSAKRPAEIRCFAAAAAGLAASIVHAMVDFVWYIPACMCATIVLMACLARLSQIVCATGPYSWRSAVLPRRRWFELTAASVVIGGWSAFAMFGPGMAAIHWDRYLRTAVVDSKLSQQDLAEFVAGGRMVSPWMRRNISEQLLRHMNRAIDWDPKFARAHRRIADRYMAEFELRMTDAANRLDITQIRDAAMASSFETTADLDDWLKRAFGPDVELLQKALQHARAAIELCPLQGDSYLHLADLCFLDRAPRAAIAAYVHQGLGVRPYDKYVLTRAGLQQLLLGHQDSAVALWSRCFNTPGRHQKEIVFRLIHCGTSAKILLDRLQPEWRTLREIWPQYRQYGSPHDLTEILAYASQAAQRETKQSNGVAPAFIWFWQASLYADVGNADQALECLTRAYRSNPHHYPIRYSLGKALQAAGRLNEAEPHVRWCLARRPEDKSLSDAIIAIARHRFAEQSLKPSALPGTIPTQPQQLQHAPGNESADATLLLR
jgi:O-antigen ligase/tetratricopeptide (TPR) repeat protein